MANTFTLISTTTVGAGGAASIDFTSIAASWTDLVLVTSLRSNRAGPDTEDSGKIEFNASTANFSWRSLRGDGQNTQSSSNTNNTVLLHQNSNGTTANTFSNAQIYIPNYAGSTNKSFSIDTVNENNATIAWQVIIAGLWSNTAAITSISIKPNVGTAWMQYSTASLYGILKGSGGATVS